MSDDEKTPLILDPEATFGNTITVSTAQVLAYQRGTEKRIQNQKDGINRLLKQLEELQGVNARDADEIARLTQALQEEQEMYMDQKARLEKTSAERDELLSILEGQAKFLSKRLDSFQGNVSDALAGEAEANWDRHADIAIDPEHEIRAAVQETLPTGEQRPGKHLAGE